MSHNYNKTIRSTGYSASSSKFTSSSSSAWDNAVDVDNSYESMEANFWNSDTNFDVDELEQDFFIDDEERAFFS